MSEVDTDDHDDLANRLDDLAERLDALEEKAKAAEMKAEGAAKAARTTTDQAEDVREVANTLHIAVQDLADDVASLRDTFRVDHTTDGGAATVTNGPDREATHPGKPSAEEMLDVGETYRAVVEDDGSGTRYGDPLTRVDGVVVFIHNREAGDLSVGEMVDVTITSTATKHAKAIVPAGDSDE